MEVQWRWRHRDGISAARRSINSRGVRRSCVLPSAWASDTRAGRHATARAAPARRVDARNSVAVAPGRRRPFTEDLIQAKCTLASRYSVICSRLCITDAASTSFRTVHRRRIVPTRFCSDRDCRAHMFSRARNQRQCPISERDYQSRRIIPVIAKPSRFLRDEKLARFQALNDPRQPLLRMNEADRETSTQGLPRASRWS